MFPIRFTPQYQVTPWGGRRFEALGRKIPSGNIGASLEISALPGQVSVICGGEFDGVTLSEACERFGRKLLGEQLTTFPFLIKLLDAACDLSVQVHPSDEDAQQLENQPVGKNEAWFFLEKPDTGIRLGLNNGVNREILSQQLNTGAILESAARFAVENGEMVYIPCGTLHVLTAGSLVVEIQDSCDITYRLYDYGSPRELHIDKGFRSLKIPNEPYNHRQQDVKSPRFSITTLTLDGSVCMTKPPRLVALTCVGGSCEVIAGGVSLELEKAGSCLIPACVDSYEIVGNVKLLETTSNL